MAVINAGVSSSEDAPFTSLEYQFLPGDYVYFTFEITGFSTRSSNGGETKKISLQYEVTPQDLAGRALAESASDEIQVELSPEDKNWVPKRRAAFLLPSFIASGSFQIHTTVKDRLANTEVSKDFPFRVGGTPIKAATSITIENFRFLRSESDSTPLSVPAYSPGDTVYARFEITGFRNGTDNQHHVAYGVTVFDPKGKALIQNPMAANLEEGSFYPAQFAPGNVALKIDKNNPLGQYIVVITVKDLLANQQFVLKQAFSIE